MTGSRGLRELQLESLIFATDFSECSQNAGIYAAMDLRIGMEEPVKDGVKPMFRSRGRRPQRYE